MIDFKNVSFGYQKQAGTIHEVSFHVNKGEFAAIIGSNGAGKTTVSKLTMGLLKPTEGTVTVAGLDTRKAKVSQIASHVGFLFQNPDRQICQGTVREEIAFGLKMVSHKSEEEINEKVEEVINTYGFRGEDAPFSLSRGERQRVALASLIALSPEILILDEPTTGLDYKECMQMMHAIQQLNAKGVTVLMVCHDMEVVLDFADRVLVMAQGKVIADDSARAIFRNPKAMEAASVLPPQIIQLSMNLGGMFAEADHVSDMVRLLKQNA